MEDEASAAAKRDADAAKRVEDGLDAEKLVAAKRKEDDSAAERLAAAAERKESAAAAGREGEEAASMVEGGEAAKREEDRVAVGMEEVTAAGSVEKVAVEAASKSVVNEGSAVGEDQADTEKAEDEHVAIVESGEVAYTGAATAENAVDEIAGIGEHSDSLRGVTITSPRDSILPIKMYKLNDSAVPSSCEALLGSSPELPHKDARGSLRDSGLDPKCDDHGLFDSSGSSSLSSGQALSESFSDVGSSNANKPGSDSFSLK